MLQLTNEGQWRVPSSYLTNAGQRCVCVTSSSKGNLYEIQYFNRFLQMYQVLNGLLKCETAMVLVLINEMITLHASNFLSVLDNYVKFDFLQPVARSSLSKSNGKLFQTGTLVHVLLNYVLCSIVHHKLPTVLEIKKKKI